MTTKDIIFFILIIVSWFSGFIVRKFMEPINVGDIIIDTSDPEKDTFRIELNTDPLALVDHKKVTFGIKVNIKSPK